MTEFNTRQLSDKFIKESHSCLLNKKNINEWIWYFIQEGKSLLEIAKHYNANYNGEYVRSSCSGLFDAFIHFKENKEFDFNAASYLSNRDGILGRHVILDDYENIVVMINFTVVDLILELEGDEFFIWFDNLTKKLNNQIIIITQ